MAAIKEIYRDSNPLMNDAFERVVAEIHLTKEKKGYTSYLIAGCEPGVGATSMTINLATSMAVAGWKTVLVDLDMRKRNKDKRIQAEADFGVSNYLAGTSAYDEIISKTNYEKLDYIAAGKDAQNVMSLVCSANMKSLMEKLKKDYDYVIINVPAFETAIDASVVTAQVDAVVLVTAQKEGRKKSIENAITSINKSGTNILGIIVNKVEINEYKRVMKNFDYYKNFKYNKRSRK